MNREEFSRQVYHIVSQIPLGNVATYGQIAWLLQAPQWARRVGGTLRYAPEGLPCHRVVNRVGRLAPGWAEQRTLLKNEGVAFRENGCVNLKESLWHITGDVL